MVVVFQFYWTPLQLEKEKQIFVEQTHATLHSAETSIIKDILGRNIASLYATLELIELDHQDLWFNLQLHDETGKRIYPLFVGQDKMMGTKHELFACKHSLILEGSSLGLLTVDIDWLPRKKELLRRLSGLRNMIVSMIILTWLITITAQYLIVSRPVYRLCETTEKVTKGEFSLSLPAQFSNDEIGKLSRSFSLMLKELSFKQMVLDQHAIVSMTDCDGIITYINEHFINITGYSKKELIGQNHSIIKSDVHSNDFFKEMWIEISKGESWHSEICNRKKTGELFWIHTTIVPQLDESGQVVQYMAISTDITRRKLIESQIDKARQEAEDASRAKSSFLANMSHEIRTPMSGIIGMTQLAINADSFDGRLTYLQKIRSSADSLLGLLNDILDFSKIEAGQLIMENSDFHFQAMLDGLLSMMSLPADEKGLNLLLSYDPATLPDFVKGDELRLRQILINLMGNSLKFTEEGSVTLEINYEDRQDNSLKFHFAIIDTGIGIPADKLDSIFTSFSQVDVSTTRKFGGTGLGLAISSQLVEMMDGKIWCESIEGQGTTFHFTVVLDQGNENEIKKKSAIRASVDQNLNLLLVEDNDFNREIAREVLQQNGHTVIEAQNGLDSLSLLNKHDIDIILMDVQMPIMDGLTTCRIIRDCEAGRDLTAFNLQDDLKTELLNTCAGKHTPIIALTANAMSGDRQRCFDAGMDDYLTKPFQPEEIEEVLYLIVQGLDPTILLANRSTESDLLSKETSSGLKTQVFQHLQTVYGMDDETAETMIQGGVDSLDSILVQVVKAMDEKEYLVLQKSAHSLKGTLLNMGLTALGKHAETIEHNATNEIPICKADSLEFIDTIRSFITDTQGDLHK